MRSSKLFLLSLSSLLLLSFLSSLPTVSSDPIPISVRERCECIGNVTSCECVKATLFLGQCTQTYLYCSEEWISEYYIMSSVSGSSKDYHIWTYSDENCEETSFQSSVECGNCSSDVNASRWYLDCKENGSMKRWEVALIVVGAVTAFLIVLIACVVAYMKWKGVRDVEYGMIQG